MFQMDHAILSFGSPADATSAVAAIRGKQLDGSRLQAIVVTHDPNTQQRGRGGANNNNNNKRAHNATNDKEPAKKAARSDNATHVVASNANNVDEANDVNNDQVAEDGDDNDDGDDEQKKNSSETATTTTTTTTTTTATTSDDKPIEFVLQPWHDVPYDEQLTRKDRQLESVLREIARTTRANIGEHECPTWLRALPRAAPIW